ncbi:MAG TPA: T9SS type A sorting domain-containing protein, partial [Puia sp.]|nr:T9SS type A sorting domain-containing protein [Puia sp.]
GRELWVEGSNDWRDMLAGAQNMMDSVAGSASYFQVTYGGGAHCCWDTEYQPSVTWTTPTNPNISQVAGAQVPMNVWQWLLRQGDTSMPKGTAAPTGTAPPTVSAGTSQTITLPVSSASLSATARANGGATVVSVYWKQSSGPVPATIGSFNSLYATVSGLTAAGNYVFTFYAVDNYGNTSNASMTVTVNAAVPAAATVVTGTPTVAAGSNQVITLPTSSVTLNGSVSANGDVISGYNWLLMSGPSFVKLSNEWGLSTVVSQLVQGTYVFELSVSDSKGAVYYSAPISIQVNAAATAGTTAAAMTGQAGFMTGMPAMADPVLTGQAGSIQFYPVPAHDLLHLRLNDDRTGKVIVGIFNLSGARVLLQQIDKPLPGIETSMDVSRFPAGVYLVEVISGPGIVTTGKFIKE